MRKIIKRILCSVLLVSFAIFTFSFSKVDIKALSKTLTISTTEAPSDDSWTDIENNVWKISGTHKTQSSYFHMQTDCSISNVSPLIMDLSNGNAVSVSINARYYGGKNATVTIGLYAKDGITLISNSATITPSTNRNDKYTETLTPIVSYDTPQEVIVKIYTTNSTNSKYVGLYGFSVSYDYISNEKSIVISNKEEQIYAGDQNIVNIETSNIDLNEVEWLIGDEEVVDLQDGVLTAMSTGQTDIMAYSNEIESEVINVKVFPNNDVPITIETALAACALLDNYKTTTREYLCSGTIKSISVVPSAPDYIGEYVITDGLNDIVVYGDSNTREIGDYVEFSGLLKNFKNTYEFSNVNMINKYTVNFDSRGGSSVSPYIDVLEGSLISKPVDPQLANYSFVGWMNGYSLWDFDTDVVTNNITLYAVWVSSALETIQTSLNKVSSKMSLSYSYNVAQGVVSDELTASNFTATSTNYKDFDNVSIESTASYKGNSAKKDESIIQLRSTNPAGIVTTKSGGLVKKITVDWNDSTTNGRTIDIYGSNSAYTSSSDLYGANKGEIIGSLVKGESAELSVKEDYQFIGIRSNSGALYVDSITIEWGGTQVISDSDFKINCGIDASALEGGFDSLLGDLEDAEYGICISNPDREPVYFSSSTNSENYQYDELNSIYYSVLNLGDMLNSNKEHLNTKFIVRAYVKYDDSYIYTEDENNIKNLSLIDLVNVYLKMDEVMDIEELASELNKLKVVLEKMGYEMYTPEEA